MKIGSFGLCVGKCRVLCGPLGVWLGTSRTSYKSLFASPRPPNSEHRLVGKGSWWQ
jgi:hypothetical protein